MSHKLLLASSSPRRKELLGKITTDFCVTKPICEEITDGEPHFIAETNAQLKGRAVEGDFVLACDTVVALDEKIYGKPTDESDAVGMLLALSDKTHSVISGVYVRYMGEENVFSDVSYVKVKPLSEKQIIDYVKDYSPLDKAGSYGLQDGVIVESYVGSKDNIIGLPTERLRKILRKYIDVTEESNY